MNKKSSAGTGTYSIIFGVAFVWFTTHFGGGFASGAQIYSYYVRFGIWCLIMPALAMLYNGIFFAYGMRFARKHEVYDYRSYNNAFYGKFAPVFSNLFEVLYICVMCNIKYTDRTSVSAVYPDHRHFYLYRCHFRHRSGAPGCLRAFYLHHCRASDCIHSEYHPRLVCHPCNRTADDNIHTTIRKGTLLRIPLRNVPAGKHCGICPARQSIQKTGRSAFSSTR